MGIDKGERFNREDVFVDYPYETVMFRWDFKEKKIYRKFYGEAESLESVPHENRLFNESLLNGEEITAAEYLIGKNA